MAFDDLERASNKLGERTNGGKKTVSIVIILLIAFAVISTVYVLYFGVPEIENKNNNNNNNDYYSNSSQAWTPEQVKEYLKDLCPDVSVNCTDFKCPEQPDCNPTYQITCDPSDVDVNITDVECNYDMNITALCPPINATSCQPFFPTCIPANSTNCQQYCEDCENCPEINVTSCEPFFPECQEVNATSCAEIDQELIFITNVNNTEQIIGTMTFNQTEHRYYITDGNIIYIVETAQ